MEHAGRYERRGEWPWVKPENWRIARCLLGEYAVPKRLLKREAVCSEIVQELRKRGCRVKN